VSLAAVTRLDDFRRAHPPRSIAVNGTVWRYVVSGNDSGPTVVLVPGGLAIHESLFPLVEQLEPRRRVIAVSLPPGMESPASFGNGVLAILAAENCERVHLAGQSFGGWLAHEFAAQHADRVSSLTLLHSFTVDERNRRRLARTAPFAAWLLRGLPGGLVNALLRSRVHRILLAPLSSRRHPDLSAWRQLAQETIASGQLLDMAICEAHILGHGTPRIYGGPVLIIESGDDPAVSARDRAALKQKHPHAQVLTLQRAGHAGAIVATEEVARAILDFT
jgi:pimeloyl-ACP methyl ester carboxylesterase